MATTWLLQKIKFLLFGFGLERKENRIETRKKKNEE